MTTEIIELIEVELKYCERCGGLWLRRIGAQQVYCPGCVPEMADFPLARNKRARAGSSASGSDLETEQAEFGICCVEGHA